MLESLKKFIEELRASGKARKNRYLVGGSAITMSLVILFWVAFLNANVRGIAYGGTAEISDNLSQNNFLSVMKRGSALLYVQLADLVSGLINQKKEIIISGQNGQGGGSAAKENFQSGELPPIAPQDIK